MKFFRNVCVFAILCLLFAGKAKADSFNPIYFDVQAKSTDPTQLGRINRTAANPQTYAMNEVFPGITNATVTYRYETFLFNSSVFVGAPYIDISTYDPQNGSSYFISAYKNSYDPTNLQTNWLGDAGFSGNYQTNDGGAFSLTLPQGANLVLVVNTTTTTLPTYPLSVTVQAYGDTNFGDPVAPTPEPASLLLAGTGLLGMAGVVRRRMKRAA